ncbi:MAG: alginate export family protein [Sphingomonadaceae bacterium]|nr:alginate export family protein [Sphingomonadaceae bacterium]
MEGHVHLYLIATASIALLSAPACAQAGTQTDESAIKLSGSIRARYETISGQPRVGFNDSDDLFNLRTIVTAEYDPGPVRFGAELYDSRVYGFDGGTPVTTNEVNALELVQAYVATTIDAPLGKGSKVDLQAGRFLLNLGSRRLVAADDYRNTTNGYTGLRADIAVRNGWSGTLVYTLPQIRLPDDAASLRDNDVKFDRESFNLVLWGGLFSKKRAFGNATAELSFFHLGESDTPARPTRNRSLETVGLRIIRDPAPDKWDFEVESFYQTGSARNGLAAASPLRNVSAWFLHADAGYSLGPSRLSVEFDYASGDKGGGSNNRFDTLFGMRRADLAPAGLYNAIGRTNILTPAVRFESVTSKRFDWFANYRAMWLASRTDSFSTTGVRDAAGNAGRFAGHQVEARARYWLVPKTLRAEVNGLLLFKGRFLDTAANAPRNGNTRYLSLNLTASF